MRLVVAATIFLASCLGGDLSSEYSDAGADVGASATDASGTGGSAAGGQSGVGGSTAAGGGGGTADPASGGTGGAPPSHDASPPKQDTTPAVDPFPTCNALRSQGPCGFLGADYKYVSRVKDGLECRTCSGEDGKPRTGCSPKAGQVCAICAEECCYNFPKAPCFYDRDCCAPMRCMDNGPGKARTCQ